MKKSKVEQMEDILHKLEDIQNSQESLMEKLAAVQIDLIEIPDKELEDALGEAHSAASTHTEFLTKITDQYEMKINSFRIGA